MQQTLRTTINRNRWDYRWFRWSTNVLDDFWPYIIIDRPPRRFATDDGTNICTYARTLFFGGVVVPALHIGVAMLWLGAVFVYPAYSFGLFNYLTVVGGGVASIAALVGGFAALVWLGRLFWRQVKHGGNVVAQSVEEGLSTSYRRWLVRREERGPGVPTLIWRFIVDQHNKVCRKIDFVDTANTGDGHVQH